MPVVLQTLRDQNGRPIAAGLVTVRDADTGALAVPTAGSNPATTDGLGQWTMTIPAGSYTMLARKGSYYSSGPLEVAGTQLIAGADFGLYRLEVDTIVYLGSTVRIEVS